MSSNTRIDNQEKKTRDIFIPWLDDMFSGRTHFISGTPVDERYDIYYQDGKGKAFIEVKQFFDNPSDFEANIIKKSKYDRLLQFASGETDQAIYIIQYCDKAYVYNLSKIPASDITVKPLWQKITNFDDNSGYACLDTCFIPIKFSKRFDISRYLDIYG